VVNAIILAAGRGTRLGALGQTIPKVLLRVGDRPLLARHFDYLARQGCSRVVVSAHHLAGDIHAFIRAYRGPLEVMCVTEASLLGTAGGVRNALAHLRPGPFVVVYGDVVVDEPLAPVLEFHRRRRSVATLLVHTAASADGKGVLRVTRHGRITSFAEKPSRHTGPALINSGVYALEPQLVSSLPPGCFSDFGEDVFPQALRQGLRLFAYRTAGSVIDIGTWDGLRQARATVCAGG
jgi:NDP-sugar pyrophosphorylase family protein